METKQELLTLNGKEYILDIEQAKQLGLLKEKDNRVRSWEEFKEKYRNECGYFYEAHKNKSVKTSSPISMCNQLTPHEAKAIAAFSKLLKLRRDWIGEWEPDWLEPEYKFTIVTDGHSIMIFNTYYNARALSFKTRLMAEEFLDTFRDLLEEAKILI